jgi:hypothetical protein
MRVQSRILIFQIRARNAVILVSEINGGAAAEGEKLHTITKLRSEVELLSGSKHSMVEVESPHRWCPCDPETTSICSSQVWPLTVSRNQCERFSLQNCESLLASP